jgi:hypothetical protein
MKSFYGTVSVIILAIILFNVGGLCSVPSNAREKKDEMSKIQVAHMPYRTIVLMPKI